MAMEANAVAMLIQAPGDILKHAVATNMSGQVSARPTADSLSLDPQPMALADRHHLPAIICRVVSAAS